MPGLKVYDPALCCPSGVCGPDVDPALGKFAADIDWLSGQGVPVVRFNLAQQPGAFASESSVKDGMAARGESALPMFLLDDQVVMSGSYPSREQLAGWFGLKAKPSTGGGCCGGSDC